jgi:sulfite exporter TauE/SafE
MTETLSLLGAVAVGLLGGVHCVGMCGGIVGAMTIRMPGQQVVSPIALLLGYNLGRILTYVVAGAVVGGIGQLGLFFVPMQAVQTALVFIAFAVMLLMGLYLGGWSHVLRHVEKVGGHLWRRLEPMGRGLLPVRHPGQAVLIGLLWGWLPCGLVYSMLIWALGTGSAVQGAALLLAFGLGTLPNLLATGLLAGQFVGAMQKPLARQVAGGLLIIFAGVTLARGLQLF